MGGVIEGAKKDSPDIMCFLETKRDLIVLVEQYWKYKKDITGMMGVKHGYIITTTESGKRKKWDIIHDSKKSHHVRSLVYRSELDKGYYAYKRAKVEPKVSEEMLEEEVFKGNTKYDIVQNNCWHFSNRVFSYLTENHTDEFPHKWVSDVWNTFYAPLLSEAQKKNLYGFISDLVAGST